MEDGDVGFSIGARWLVPADGPILENVRLAIRGGLLSSIDHDRASAVIDLGDVAVIPGLVNAHTHLDLSHAGPPISASGGMADWLHAVVSWRRAHAVSPGAMEDGIAELVRAGTTLVGDISPTGDSQRALGEAGLAGTVFREIVGLRPERYQPQLEMHLPAMDVVMSPWVRSELSPHAPYSTAREVYRQCRQAAAGRVLCTHWLESAEEVEYLRTGGGPIRDFLEGIGAWVEVSAPLGDVWDECLGSARWTLVHANYLSAEDVERLSILAREGRVAVVYCPRTHAHFGHAPHPFRELLQAGVRVALGTDSLASNPDLDILAEARFLQGLVPDLDPRVILRMVTVNGVLALGWENGFGDIGVGKSATFTAVRCEESTGEVAASLFRPGSRVTASMIGGRWLLEPGA
jgi:cytosine/adenosine deaminase-related metal-dependent hydrolase